MIVTSFWHGGRLSSLGYLTFKSYLDHGYSVDLYSYDEVTNVPSGVRLKDASLIAQTPEEFGVADIRIFSDYWRFCFLANFGGTWIDADCPVVRELDFLGSLPFFGRETLQWGGGLFAGLIHSPVPGQPAMVGLKEYYENPPLEGSTVRDRRNNIDWYAFCHEFYRFASLTEQSLNPGQFTPLDCPGALDGQTLSVEGRYDGSVRLIDYSSSYTLHLIGCYFGFWKREDISKASLIGDLIDKHIGDIDPQEFLFGF